ncbi:ROK family protein [Candidatus Nanosalina sp. VS9-1]|uniref:ROK family protein n=1 Tax=Candidatus Nanosalina sp. VS9-1 TaxID=3388566 RepID=UPI0039E00E83
MAFLCIDIGGTNTIVGVGNGDFESVAKYSTGEFVENVREMIDEALKPSHIQQEDIEQVAVAAAGPIDREKMVFYPPNVSDKQGLEKINLEKALAGLGEITIINDCTSAVLGEYHYGGHKTDNLVYVTISSGIGAGAIIQGQLIEGKDGNFAEVGHMEISTELECGCGGQGHWEAYASGENLPKMADQLFDLKYDNAVEIFEQYNRGDSQAQKVISQMQEANIQGLSNVATLYDPDKIVLGGAVALNHPETVVEPLEERVEERSVNSTPEVDLCSLGEKSVIHGLRAVCNGKHSN